MYIEYMYYTSDTIRPHPEGGGGGTNVECGNVILDKSLLGFGSSQLTERLVAKEPGVKILKPLQN